MALLIKTCDPSPNAARVRRTDKRTRAARIWGCES